MDANAREKTDIDVLILCGGMGTRLRPLVNDRPKSMVEFNGKPFLEILLNYLKGFGFCRYIFCIGYLGNAISSYFGNGQRYDVEIIYSNEDEPLGTGGAIKNAERLIQSNIFLVLNGDSFTPVDLPELIAFHRLHQADISMTLVSRENLDSRYGNVKIAADGRITQFSEKNREDSQGLINAGIYAISANILKSFPPSQFLSIEHDIFASQIDQLKIFGMPVYCNFLDFGVPEAYLYLKEHYREIFGILS